jgi:hypothetical protein
MLKDRLFLLNAPFEDPAYPGTVFYCEHCLLMEGLIAGWPELNEHIDIQRIDWPRPRPELVDLLGGENQSCPVLILSDSGEGCTGVQVHGDVFFINEKDAILQALAHRHRLPAPHP